MKKLKYIANLRLPTEKAHSIQIMKMCEAFARQGIEVELVIPHKRDNIGVGDAFAYYGIKTPFTITRRRGTDFLGLTQRLGWIFYWVDLFTFLVSLSFVSTDEDTVLYTRDAKLLLPFFFRNCKKIVELHSFPKQPGFLIRFLMKADKLVTVTTYLKKVLVGHGFSSERIFVAPDAVDIEAYTLSIDKSEARQHFSLPREGRFIGYVGMLRTMGMDKGVDLALKALTQLPSDISMVFVGGHPADVTFYKKRATELGISEKTIFTGRLAYSEIPACLKAFDVLIAPFPDNEHYRHFMSPLKIFEYMASGVPIVASDLPSLREIIDERTATLFSPGNLDAFVTALNRTLEDASASALRAKEARRLVEEYSWYKRAERINNFIG